MEETEVLVVVDMAISRPQAPETHLVQVLHKELMVAPVVVDQHGQMVVAVAVQEMPVKQFPEAPAHHWPSMEAKAAPAWPLQFLEHQLFTLAVAVAEVKHHQEVQPHSEVLSLQQLVDHKAVAVTAVRQEVPELTVLQILAVVEAVVVIQQDQAQAAPVSSFSSIQSHPLQQLQQLKNILQHHHLQYQQA
jgi:hypothetical protein